MGKPTARITDQTTSGVLTEPVEPTVTVGGQPVAVLTSTHVCKRCGGQGPVQTAVRNVLVGPDNLPVAVIGDQSTCRCSNENAIVTGDTTVLIGENGPGLAKRSDDETVDLQFIAMDPERSKIKNRVNKRGLEVWESAMQVESVSDLVNKAIEAANGRKIRSLWFADHSFTYNRWMGLFGGDVGQRVGQDEIPADVPEPLAAELGRLRSHFTPDAIVVFHGCSLGTNEPLLRNLSGILGVPVQAGLEPQSPETPDLDGPVVTCGELSCSTEGDLTTYRWKLRLAMARNIVENTVNHFRSWPFGQNPRIPLKPPGKGEF
jgi:uncharacterized Zn-binding protein involved in type VI secretion